MSTNNSRVSQPPDSVITNCKRGDTAAFKTIIEMTQQYYSEPNDELKKKIIFEFIETEMQIDL